MIKLDIKYRCVRVSIVRSASTKYFSEIIFDSSVQNNIILICDTVVVLYISNIRSIVE